MISENRFLGPRTTDGRKVQVVPLHRRPTTLRKIRSQLDLVDPRREYPESLVPFFPGKTLPNIPPPIPPRPTFTSYQSSPSTSSSVSIPTSLPLERASISFTPSIYATPPQTASELQGQSGYPSVYSYEIEESVDLPNPHSSYQDMDTCTSSPHLINEAMALTDSPPGRQSKRFLPPTPLPSSPSSSRNITHLPHSLLPLMTSSCPPTPSTSRSIRFDTRADPPWSARHVPPDPTPPPGVSTFTSRPTVEEHLGVLKKTILALESVVLEDRLSSFSSPSSRQQHATHFPRPSHVPSSPSVRHSSITSSPPDKKSNHHTPRRSHSTDSSSSSKSIGISHGLHVQLDIETETELHLLRSQLSTNSQQISNLQSRVSSLTNLNRQLSDDLHSKDTQLSTLKHTLMEERNKREEYLHIVNEQESEIARLREERESSSAKYEVRIKDLISELEDYQEVMKSHTGELARMREEIETEKKERDTIGGELDGLRGENTRLRLMCRSSTSHGNGGFTGGGMGSGGGGREREAWRGFQQLGTWG
ncbi:hypothetical protein M231_02288 [Tremella mesenterica]|uniref:Uncharacterized protein n=1 Tax=Tremella mesenterica TaxID=5217 RepID=A0A4Q1BR66_TREME|nr:hypothetical protein M231_02288 [Tremella mesenterica]